MKKNETIQSVLNLNKVVFDKIEFKRIGFGDSSEHELEFEIQSNIAQRQDDEVYKITLLFVGKKPEEYTLEISLTGFFTLEQFEELSEDLKHSIITKNTVAILMPYLRSEISLLTAQPGMECIVLPPFNINKMVKNKDKK